jgi:thiol-disulfide isomerase/thioredoxin
MRSIASLFVLSVALGLSPGLLFADESGAAEDKRALESWLEGQTPKSEAEKKTLRAELERRLRAFLVAHTGTDAPTSSVRASLADFLYETKKLDEALGLYEKLLTGEAAGLHPRARHGIVKILVAKKDLKGARARLDAFCKAHPDEVSLAGIDEYLAQLESGQAVKEGASPPPIHVKSLSGEDVVLEDLKGKVVLLDFWATWCPPCKKALPSLKRLHAELHEKGLEIVGIDGLEKDEDELKAFLSREQVAWPQIVGKTAKVLTRAYGVEALPRTILIGRDGKIAAIGLRGEPLRKAVRAALSAK